MCYSSVLDYGYLKSVVVVVVIVVVVVFEKRRFIFECKQDQQA